MPECECRIRLEDVKGLSDLPEGVAKLERFLVEFCPLHNAAAALRKALADIAPLNGSGLIDEIWHHCRRSGREDLADRIVPMANTARAVLAEAKG